jgi:hypothetical protein
MEMYCTQITSWSPQEMRVLRQCTVPRAEVMFVNIQLENIRPSKKLTRLLQCLNCPMFAVRLWITTSPYHWPIGSLPSTCMLCTPPHCTKDVYTPQGSTRDLWTYLYEAENIVIFTAVRTSDLTTLNQLADFYVTFHAIWCHPIFVLSISCE